jgi:intracellular septation protein
LLGYVFDSAFRLDAEGWRILTYRWGLYLPADGGVINEVIWRNFSTDFWIAFKVWGNLPLSIVFTHACNCR